MLRLAAAMMFAATLCSCLAGAAIGAAGDVVEAGVKTTGAVVGAVIPDGDDDDDDEDDDDRSR